MKGSSPRVRGTGEAITDAVDTVGIIPACAGNRQVQLVKLVANSGSSPRVRGTGEVELDADFGKGIIPACAGNRFLEAYSPLHVRDHPRVCGEQKIEYSS